MKRWIAGGAAALSLLAVAPALAQSQAVNGQAYPSTPTAVTITTHAVFQQIAVASLTRRGCFYQNTSADTEFLFLGTTAAATTASSVKILAGQAVNCSSGVIVASDAIQVTSSATDGATGVLYLQ